MPVLSEPNIVLTGFMGTGKSHIGLMLAEALDRVFVDMDDLIVEKAGLSIPEVFASQGEERFRQLELEVCLEVAKPASLVVATGGGTVVNPACREALANSGSLICLTATPQEILKRVGSDSNRPMLDTQGGSREERIKVLMEERAPHYNAIAQQVDTTCLTHCEVVSQIRQLICL